MPGFSQTRLAARLQEVVSKRRQEVGLYTEIAEKLPLAKAERLLDVGTGTGLQLRVIHEMQPQIELFGLDLSAHAIQLARAHLSQMPINLQVGSIQETSYPDDFFDIITCSSSMSYWQNINACFNEIYRICKPGGFAILFEPRQDIDLDQAVEIIRDNLADANPLRRWLAVSLNRFGLRYGRSLGLTLYAMEDIESIAHQSWFSENATVQSITLQNLPIFMQITLTKV